MTTDNDLQIAYEIEHLEREVERLSDLSDDWDGAGSIAPVPNAIHEASQFCKIAIQEGLFEKAPTLKPGTLGEVSVLFGDLEIEFDDNGEMSWFHPSYNVEGRHE